MMTKEKAVSTVVNCAKDYQQRLENRKLLILFQKEPNSRETATLELSFYRHHFKHLTGLMTPLKANLFYKKCLNSRLSPTEIELHSDGTTDLKLNVLQHILRADAFRMVGRYNQSRPLLMTDYLAGGVRACMGFVEDTSDGLVPNCVLRTDIRNITETCHRVFAVFRKNNGDEPYREVYYKARTDWSTIVFPPEYQYLAPLCFPQSAGTSAPETVTE